MKLQFAFLADAATIQDNGLFAVVGGGFDVIQVAQFPTVKHAMVLVGRVHFAKEEIGKTYNLHVEIIGPDGKSVPPEMWMLLKPFAHPRHEERGNWLTCMCQLSRCRIKGPRVLPVQVVC
jgi:hypothetical protein